MPADWLVALDFRTTLLSCRVRCFTFLVVLYSGSAYLSNIDYPMDPIVMGDPVPASNDMEKQGVGGGGHNIKQNEDFVEHVHLARSLTSHVTPRMLAFALWIALTGWFVQFDLGYTGIVYQMQPFNRSFGACKQIHAAGALAGTTTESCSLTATQQSIISIYLLFMAIGAAASGFFGSWLGRKSVIRFGWALIAVAASGLVGSAGSYAGYVVCKYLNGFGIGLVVATGPAYSAECTPSKKRGLVVAVYTSGLGFGAVEILQMNYHCDLCQLLTVKLFLYCTHLYLPREATREEINSSLPTSLRLHSTVRTKQSQTIVIIRTAVQAGADCVARPSIPSHMRGVSSAAETLSSSMSGMQNFALGGPDHAVSLRGDGTAITGIGLAVLSRRLPLSADTWQSDVADSVNMSLIAYQTLDQQKTVQLGVMLIRHYCASLREGMIYILSSKQASWEWSGCNLTSMPHTFKMLTILRLAM